MEKYIGFIFGFFIALMMLTGCARKQVHYDGYFQFGSADWETQPTSKPPVSGPSPVPSVAPSPRMAPVSSGGVPAHFSLSPAPNVILVPWSRQSPAAVGARSHTVRKGDTLISLARHFYGDPAQWRLIYEANRNIIGDPDNVSAGVKLQIP